MKQLFLVYLLFLNLDGKVEVIQTVDKCKSWNAHESANWLGDPKHWGNLYLPVDYFVLPYDVTEEEWSKHCYRPKSRKHFEYIFFGSKELVLPKVECP